jgi:hypothetical protein
LRYYKERPKDPVPQNRLDAGQRSALSNRRIAKKRIILLKVSLIYEYRFTERYSKMRLQMPDQSNEKTYEFVLPSTTTTTADIVNLIKVVVEHVIPSTHRLSRVNTTTTGNAVTVVITTVPIRG